MFGHVVTAWLMSFPWGLTSQTTVVLGDSLCGLEDEMVEGVEDVVRV